MPGSDCSALREVNPNLHETVYTKIDSIVSKEDQAMRQETVTIWMKK